MKFCHKNWHWLQCWHIFQYRTHMKISWHTTSGIQGQQHYARNIQQNETFWSVVVQTILTDKQKCSLGTSNFSQSAQNITFTFLFWCWLDYPLHCSILHRYGLFKVRKLPNVFCLYMCFCFVFIGDLFIMLLVFLSWNVVTGQAVL